MIHIRSTWLVLAGIFATLQISPVLARQACPIAILAQLSIVVDGQNVGSGEFVSGGAEREIHEHVPLYASVADDLVAESPFRTDWTSGRLPLLARDGAVISPGTECIAPSKRKYTCIELAVAGEQQILRFNLAPYEVEMGVLSVDRRMIAVLSRYRSNEKRTLKDWLLGWIHYPGYDRVRVYLIAMQESRICHWDVESKSRAPSVVVSWKKSDPARPSGTTTRNGKNGEP